MDMPNLAEEVKVKRPKRKKTEAEILKRLKTIAVRMDKKWEQETKRIIASEAKRAGITILDVLQHLDRELFRRGFATPSRRRLEIRGAIRDAKSRLDSSALR